LQTDIIETEYKRRRELTLLPLSKKLQALLSDLLSSYPRVDSVRSRAKRIDRFLEKAQKVTDDGGPKYTNPLNQIQDQLAARVVVFYLADVEEICVIVKKYFRSIEERTIVPDSPSEFGYEGKHFILFVPDDLVDTSWTRSDYPTFFELQVKTLFQHAWAEADHDLDYKSTSGLSVDQRRQVAFTAAQAWGADRVFEELASELGLKPPDAS
jgi:putative GTP pyrophosphokinase